MLDAFHISASGMHAQQLRVEVIANNLANVATPGFKKSKVDFEDLMYRQMSSANGLLSAPDIKNPVGTGVAVASVGKVFSQGEISNTSRPLDVAINGDGFLELVLPDGQHAYTRTGSLNINRDGMLVNSDGHPLSAGIQLPPDMERLVIDTDGAVRVKVSGDAQMFEVGRIELAGFINPSGLTPMGDNLYIPSHDSGDVFYGSPDEGNFGVLSQGFLEGANVDLAEELTQLMLAQRGYEMNAKVIQASDDILGIINNLRR